MRDEESTRARERDCVATHSSNVILEVAGDQNTVEPPTTIRKPTEVSAFETWCRDKNHLFVNVCKTKEMIQTSAIFLSISDS